MQKQLQTYIASFLLLVLAGTLIPAETFHHHEEATVVCHESTNHVEEPFFECELCDFVLPAYEIGFQTANIKAQPLLTEFILNKAMNPSSSAHNFYKGRAPPKLG